MISVVIPTYNEEKALPNTMRQLLLQPGDYEVIVVDGGSTDGTLELAKAIVGDGRWAIGDGSPKVDLKTDRSVSNSPSPMAYSLRHWVVLSATKGRASQMNTGAKYATGEWLLFLHGDTILPPGAIQRLNALEADHTVRAGGFLHQFSGNDWRLRLISFLDNFRCARSRIIYGDQALFVRRRLFWQLGGFPAQPILEDVVFCERLIKVTSPLLLSPPVVTDSRKFVQMGIWRSFGRVLAIILHVEWGLPILPHTFFQDIR